MATRKQIAAAKRNLKKARAARRKGKGKKSAHRRPHVTKTSTKKLKTVRRHLRAATKSLKHAHAVL